MPDREKVISALEKACRDSVELPPCAGRIEITKEAIEEGILPLLREQEKSGWISVNDRLPEPPAQCLVYSDKACRPRGMETATYTKMGWMTAAYFPEVTHWMPLPEPPEERK